MTGAASRPVDQPRMAFSAPSLVRRATFLALALALGACWRHPITTVTPTGVEVPIGDPPPSFVRTTSDLRSTRVIDVRPGLAKPAAFKLVTDALSQLYTIDVTDPRAGFVMTTWQASFRRAGIPDARYRTRLVVRFLGDDWSQLSVRVDANWQHGDEWDIGYDSGILDQTVSDLTLRLGTR